MLDSLRRGEAPLASHLLWPGILDDAVLEERQLGINAGLAWYEVAEASVVYTDFGVSAAMKMGIDKAGSWNLPVERRSLMDARINGHPLPIANKHKGALGELKAATWLLEQGYEVFRNVSQHGRVDLIAFHPDTTEVVFLDVKTVHYPHFESMRNSLGRKQEAPVRFMLYNPDADFCELLPLPVAPSEAAGEPK